MESAIPTDVESSKRRRTIRIATARALLITAAVLVGALAVFAAWTVATLPPLDLPETPPAHLAALLVDRDGTPFAERGARRDPPVDAAALPAHVTQAFVAIEDRRFFQHHGIDLRGLARAALVDLRSGSSAQGGSTITQQLAKNTLFGSEQSLRRKLQEAVAAVWLERRLSKSEILSRYLNSVYFGDGAYGLGAAARVYFDTTPDELSLSQAAMLAGLVKAPSQLSPRKHLAAAQARERVVLAAMADARYLTPVQASAVPLALPVQGRALDETGGYFADWVYGQVGSGLPPGYGAVVVRTSLDLRLQRKAEAAVRTALARHGAAGAVSQAALVAMRPDGTVVAMVGGRDHDQSPYNRATQARRQPGSAFKLFAYLAAFRNGAAPDTLVSDAPLRIGRWEPTNADGRNAGVITLEQAFAQSRNLPAIRISEQVGRGEVIRAARDLGVTSPLEAVPSLPLGTSGVTLLELTSSYAAVAGGAYPIHASGVGREGDQVGDAMTPLDWSTERGPLLQVLHAAVDYGTARGAALPIPVYGKTGTTQNTRDAVFVGFAGDLVVGVWVGNDDEKPMRRVSGGSLPVEIWRDFMQTAIADQIAAATAAPPVEPLVEGSDDPDAAAQPPPPSWIDRMRDFFARVL